MECPVCKKEFNEKTGRRPKKFCSDPCKVIFWNSQKKAKKLAKEIKEEKEARSNPLINAARGRDANGVNNDELKFQKPVKKEATNLKIVSKIQYKAPDQSSYDSKRISHLLSDEAGQMPAPPKMTAAQIEYMCPKDLKGWARKVWIYDKKKENGLI